MAQPPSMAEYLQMGRQLAGLLGSSLEGPSGDALKELARAYDPSANDSRISAEVFLFHKYLLVQTCIGMFPESHVEHVVGGLFAALNERAAGLDFSQERQDAMEQMWRMRAKAFDAPFSHDRTHFLEEGSDGIYWKQSLAQFCRNVSTFEQPPDIWAGGRGPSHKASLTITEAMKQMITVMSEITRLHFGTAV